MIRLTICVLFAMLAAGPAMAAQWYVDGSAAAGGDGSADAPFQTINDVKSVLTTGDTVYIRDGVYSETVDFWHVPEGSGERTVIRAEEGHRPVIDGGGGSGNFVFQAGETHFMTFQGLTVRNHQGSAFHFYFAHDGQVIDCKTESVGRAVAFYHSSRGLVRNCDLEGGVSGKESDGTILEGNYIYHSNAEGITLHADSKNCQYLGNVVYDNVSVNIYIDSASNMIIDGNLVYMTGDPPEELAGIQLADESYDNVTAPVMRDITVTNNVLINNYYGFVFWRGHFPDESALVNVTVANNTIINSKGASITWDTGPHENSVVRNNIVANASDVGRLLLVAKSTDGITLDHNLWFMPHVGEPFNWGGGTVYDFEGYRTASGQGSGSLMADPLFEGPWELPVENFIPAAGSPAIDAGAEVAGLNHDFLRNGRPSGAAFDLGAFEVGAAPADDTEMLELPERTDADVAPEVVDVTGDAVDAAADDGGPGPDGDGGDEGCGCSVVGS